MKITFLATYLKINGGNRIILTYARVLARKGHDVCIIARTKGNFRRAVKNALNIKPNWMPMAAKVIWTAGYDENNIPDGDVVVATALETAGAGGFFSPPKRKKIFFF